jgi:hypothetical protein
MKAELMAGDTTISELTVDVATLRVEIRKRDERIENMNAKWRQKVTEERIRVETARQAVIDLQVENTRLQEELGVTRFETLEAIRDDEDFADWVDWTVPSAGWRLLQQASEGVRD